MSIRYSPDTVPVFIAYLTIPAHSVETQALKQLYYTNNIAYILTSWYNVSVLQFSDNVSLNTCSCLAGQWSVDRCTLFYRCQLWREIKYYISRCHCPVLAYIKL